MEILKVRFRTNQEFAGAYQKELAYGGLFCPTTTPLRVGSKVVCELVIPALPNKILVRGVVRSWRPALPRLRVRAGATIEFAPEEADKRDFILQTLKGERPPAPRRRHTRLPVEIPVRYRTPESADFRAGGLSEISIGGALLLAEKLAVDTEVILEVTPPGAVSPLAISGVVTYHTAGGASGIKFHSRDAGGSRRLRELIRRLKLA
ncbi:MAG: PilZ domain-containing protein [Deltaproteobacteria bacterium]|nr:PilZ domain-containing protein [Deltaproteobacteria bacterium]